MSSIQSRRLALVAAAATTALLAGAEPGAAIAAEAAAGPTTVEEVVVTAQKRSQNVQTVPIAITAFTAKALKDRGVQSVHDLSSLTPNVNLDAGSPFSGSSAVLSASIRGIGQDDFAMNLDPGVGVYLDGVYLGPDDRGQPRLARCRAHRNPQGAQGTLFGRNTIGGAISVVTHTPSDVYSADVSATTGSYSRRDFQAIVDLPINDTLLSSLTFSSEQRDGWQRVVPYTAAAGYVQNSSLFDAAGHQTSATNGGQDHNPCAASCSGRPATASRSP